MKILISLTLFILIIIHSVSFAEYSQLNQSKAIGLALSLPALISVNFWVNNRNYFEYSMVGSYRYLNKFFEDYYLGIGYLNGQDEIRGNFFGTIGIASQTNIDWMYLDLGLIYFPSFTGAFSLLPIVQIGTRLKF
ncbi:MAG: hypothetical protein ABIH50_02990 [bacterium]